ncbi:MAG: hypothetical protein AAGA99_27405 [Actinomycetota bacterium]
MSDVLPTTVFDVYDALFELLQSWPANHTLQGEEVLDNDDKQTSRWALWVGNATDGGTETEFALDLAGGSAREESYSIEWAITGNDGRSGMTAAELRAELREHVARLHTLVLADHTLGGTCTWCMVVVEYVDHGGTDAGALARVGGTFEIVAQLEP